MKTERTRTMVRNDEARPALLSGAGWNRAIAVAILLAAGSSGVQAITPGRVVAWGDNTNGETNVPAGLSDVIAISAGNTLGLALKNDGTVVAWGCSPCGGQLNIPVGLSGVTAVSAGAGYALALKNDGTVVGWGENASGQTSIPSGLSGVTAIAAGRGHRLALKSGVVVGWGSNSDGQATPPSGLSGVVAIAAGASFSMALQSDGTVSAWGRNLSGETVVPSGLKGVTAISAGLVHSMALKSDGTVVAWGSNVFGQCSVPAGLSGVIAIQAGVTYSMALKSDGTIVAWGGNQTGELNVPASNAVMAIAAGDGFGLAIVPNDSTAPVITPTITGTLGNNSWYINTVSIDWAVTDNESAVSMKSGCDSSMITVDTAGTSFNCTATSLGGTSSYPLTIKRDSANPMLACAAPDGLWHANDVSIGCTASDFMPGSGLANSSDASFNLTTSVAVGTESANASTSSRTVMDNAGNYAVAAAIPGNKVDKKAPGISIDSPTSMTYLLNQKVATSYSCNDGGSGVASCAGPVASGASLNTAEAGTKKFTVNAADKVGNRGTAAVNYTVGYNFGGFKSPVASAPAVNAGQAGRAYPIAWQLFDGAGKFVSALSAVASVAAEAMPCVGTGPTTLLVANLTGSSGLRYDVKANLYIYNWATPSMPGCYTLLLTLDSGQAFPIYFNLSK